MEHRAIKQYRLGKVAKKLAIAAALIAVSSIAIAESGDTSLGRVAQNVGVGMMDVGKLIAAVSYVAGLGFALMGLLKLKAHKDQPTQVTLSQPLVLLIIAAGLAFLPSLIETMGGTFWKGGTQGSAGMSGSGIKGLGDGGGAP